jgi:hypothetical protein
MRDVCNERLLRYHIIPCSVQRKLWKEGASNRRISVRTHVTTGVTLDSPYRGHVC